jgi:hypothetical protein
MVLCVPVFIESMQIIQERRSNRQANTHCKPHRSRSVRANCGLFGKLLNGLAHTKRSGKAGVDKPLVSSFEQLALNGLGTVVKDFVLFGRIVGMENQLAIKTFMDLDNARKDIRVGVDLVQSSNCHEPGNSAKAKDFHAFQLGQVHETIRYKFQGIGDELIEALQRLFLHLGVGLVGEITQIARCRITTSSRHSAAKRQGTLVDIVFQVITNYIGLLQEQSHLIRQVHFGSNALLFQARRLEEPTPQAFTDQSSDKVTVSIIILFNIGRALSQIFVHKLGHAFRHALGNVLNDFL